MWQWLRTNDPDYHSFLYSILEQLPANSSIALLFLLREILRLEPRTKKFIRILRTLINLFDSVGILYNIHSFLDVATAPPFHFTLISLAWTDFVRTKVCKEHLEVLQRASELLGADPHLVDYCYVWSLVVYPEKDAGALHGPPRCSI